MDAEHVEGVVNAGELLEAVDAPQADEAGDDAEIDDAIANCPVQAISED